MGPTRELLTEHLQAAISDCESGRDDPFEVAVLAGLLSRRVAKDAPSEAEAQALIEAERLRQSGVLSAALPDEDQASDAVDQIKAARIEDYEEERTDPLFDLDDLCAGAWFVGEPNRYTAQITQAMAAIHAAPETWRTTSQCASVILSDASPLPDDASLALWNCVASCGGNRR